MPELVYTPEGVEFEAEIVPGVAGFFPMQIDHPTGLALADFMWTHAGRRLLVRMQLLPPRD